MQHARETHNERISTTDTSSSVIVIMSEEFNDNMHNRSNRKSIKSNH